jgi:2-phosphoglycerate kinase
MSPLPATTPRTDDFQLIIHTKNHTIPFSRGFLVDTLLSLGMTYEHAFSFAGTISEEFPYVFSSGVVSGTDFQKYVSQHLIAVSPQWASRFQLFNLEENALNPLIILIGGTPGIGKSTLANLVARRLKATNLLGTDILREILRGIISTSLMPALHFSSFESSQFLSGDLLTRQNPIIVGFEQQATKVMVAIESVISHQLQLPDISIVEGVHLVPTLINPELINNPRVIFLMLSLDNEQKHLSRLKRRARNHPSRKSERLIELFDNIRVINHYLIKKAKEANIPVIDCENTESAIEILMNEIWKKIITQIKPKEESVESSISSTE